MPAPPGAAPQVAPPVPLLNDLLRYSDTTVFAVLSAATSRVLYLSPNAGIVLDIEPEAVTGCATQRRSQTLLTPRHAQALACELGRRHAARCRHAVRAGRACSRARRRRGRTP